MGKLGHQLRVLIPLMLNFQRVAMICCGHQKKLSDFEKYPKVHAFQPATTKAAAKVPEVLKGIPHLTSSNLWNLRSLPPRIQLSRNSDCEHWISTYYATTWLFLVFRGCWAVENSWKFFSDTGCSQMRRLQDGSSRCRAYWLGLLADGAVGWTWDLTCSWGILEIIMSTGHDMEAFEHHNWDLTRLQRLVSPKQREMTYPSPPFIYPLGPGTATIGTPKELAQTFQRLGCEVTVVIGTSGKIMGKEDDDASELVPRHTSAYLVCWDWWAWIIMNNPFVAIRPGLAF